MIDDIEDNYSDYLEDERGYAWDAWDVLPADVIRRHDAFAAAPPDELTEIDPVGLDDLDRWAYARACRAHGAHDSFLAAVRLMLASTEKHRAIQYAEIFIAAAEAMAKAGLRDEAQLHLTTFRERWPSDTRAARIAVFISTEEELEASIEAALSEVGNDADRLYEIAEDLVPRNPDAATQLLNHVDQAARDQGHTALLLDIELLREQLVTE